jgi:ParB-like chromosome segregation protein Spo0J
MSISAHPLAELIPAMTDDELAGLVDDIKANGLREPITLYEGLILDGRHRARACEILEIEPEARIFDGADPLAFVLSANLHRRHLSTSQRAMIAAKLATLRREDTLRRGPDLQKRRTGMSQGEAAGLLGVGVVTVNSANAIRKHGTTELITAVERGEIPVKPAAEIARRPPEEQAKAMDDRREEKRAKQQTKNEKLTETERQRQLALTAHRRLSSVCGTLAGIVQGLPRLRVDAAVAVAKPTDIDQWIECTGDAVSSLRRLLSKLKEAR